MKNTPIIHTALHAMLLALPIALLCPSSYAQTVYEPYVEPKVLDWKQSNQAVQDAGGWRTYLKQVHESMKQDAADQKALVSSAANNNPSTSPSLTTSTSTSTHPQPLSLAQVEQRALQLKNLTHYDLLANDSHAIEAVLNIQRLWTSAIADEQLRILAARLKDNAQAAAELAKRMVQAGNAPAVNHAKAHLAYLNTVQAYVIVQHAALQSSHALRHALLMGEADALVLPLALPAPPRRPERVSGLTTLQRERLNLQDTDAAYQAAHQLTSLANGDALLLTKQILDDALLRYNGMIVGTFDLLNAHRDWVQAQIAATQALAQFWLADAARQASLRGVLTPVKLNGSAGNDAKPAQH